MRHQATHVTGNGSVETSQKVSGVTEYRVGCKFKLSYVTPSSNVSSEVLHLQGQDLEKDIEPLEC